MSGIEIIIILTYITWIGTVFVASIFCISGTDDLFFDFIFLVYYFRKKIKKNSSQAIKLDNIVEQKIAIMVACWHEHQVIGRMLTHNLPRIAYKNYDVFIGVYPNDHETIAVLNKIKHQFANLHIVIGHTPGPTTKSENLNIVYDYILNYELEKKAPYTIILMHDSEDIIHPLALKLYNAKIPEYDMVQTPVLPLPGDHKSITQWIYNDEFGEAHLKDIRVRIFISGFIPSAGVGTGFSRNAFNVLTANNTKAPFAKGVLTEDYNTALKIHLKKLKSIFILESATINQEKKWLRGNTVNEYIATRSLFPKTYTTALRQRTRWMIGIALQEWELTGWPGTWATRYLLMHDRKSIFVNIISGLGYLFFLLSILIYLTTLIVPAFADQVDILNQHPWTYLLITATSCLLIIRMTQRAVITYRLYGFKAAIGSILRIFYANILNTNTSIMALYTFIKMKYKRQVIKWNKTMNSFPENHT